MNWPGTIQEIKTSAGSGQGQPQDASLATYHMRHGRGKLIEMPR